MDFLSQLDWRRAEKNFDPTKKVSEDDLKKILHAIQMAPSSFGIQPYHIYVVSDPEVKKQLRASAYHQAQFEEASHLLVFASRSDLGARVNAYFEMASGGSPEVREKMKEYEAMMEGFVSGLPEGAHKAWADRQAYIALGFALAAAAELGIDSCPMEGFNSAEFDSILKLPTSQKSAVVLSLGYRKMEEAHPKVRFPESDLFTF